MEIRYQFLDKSFIPEIHQCWMDSFKNYQVDMSYMTIERMISRARMDRVDFSLSVGAFDSNNMIGFLLIGIDRINKEMIAFDAGTGVIEEYRGNGIAGGMLDFATNKLKFVGIEKFILEVIQDNKSAVKAYQKAGFSITRDFNCYKLNTKNFCQKGSLENNIEINAINKEELSDYIHLQDWEVSWEYNYSAIENIHEHLIINGAFINKQCIGLIVFYPTLNWIFMLGVKDEYIGKNIEELLIADLLENIDPDVDEIKFHNIPPDNRMNEVIQNCGFKIYVKQYEMEYKLQ